MFLTKTQTDKYADVMLWALQTARRNGKFKPYDVVLLRYEPLALPLAQSLYKKMLENKFHVVVRQDNPEEFARLFYTLGDDKQLTFVSPWDKELQQGVNGLISLRAPADLTSLRARTKRAFFLDVVQLPHAGAGQTRRAERKRICGPNCARLLFKREGPGQEMAGSNRPNGRNSQVAVRTAGGNVPRTVRPYGF